MDELAEKLSQWFGSTPFIILHVIWFALWFPLGGPLELLTLIVSLEAIFLSLFILRGENAQTGRIEGLVKSIKRLAKRTEEISKKDLTATNEIKDLLEATLEKVL